MEGRLLPVNDFKGRKRYEGTFAGIRVSEIEEGEYFIIPALANLSPASIFKKTKKGVFFLHPKGEWWERSLYSDVLVIPLEMPDSDVITFKVITGC